MDCCKYPFIRQNRQMIPDGENPGPISRTVCTLPFGLDNVWILDFGLWPLDWKSEDFRVIGRFLGDCENVGFSSFHLSNLLDKRLAIGRILGDWENFGRLENPNLSKIQVRIGNWKLEN